MMDAEPMTMPSMVRRKRTLLALKLSTARRTISLNIMVERALARVRSKELGFGMLVVAIAFKIRLLPVSQWCEVSGECQSRFLCRLILKQQPCNSIILNQFYCRHMHRCKMCAKCSILLGI